VELGKKMWDQLQLDWFVKELIAQPAAALERYYLARDIRKGSLLARTVVKANLGDLKR